MGPGILLSEMTDTPLITFSPAGPMPILMEGSGNVINLSVQPLITGKNASISHKSKMAKHLNIWSGRYIEPMTLKERLMNHVMNVMTNTYMNWLNSRIHAVRVREVDPNLPISDEIMKYKYFQSRKRLYIHKCPSVRPFVCPSQKPLNSWNHHHSSFIFPSFRDF